MCLRLSGSLGSEMQCCYTLLVFEKPKMARLGHGFLSHLLTEYFIGLSGEDSPKTLRHERPQAQPFMQKHHPSGGLGKINIRNRDSRIS